MIESSEAYKRAVVADTRRILLRAVVDITDPDIIYGTVDGVSGAPFSIPEQIYDHVFTLYPNYATLERNRWLLNGNFTLLPDNENPDGQVGFVGSAISDDSSEYAQTQYVQENFSNVSILQACSIYFPNANFDGVAEDFTVSVYQGGTAYFTKSFTGNTEAEIVLTGFTVNNPDCIRLEVTKWSLPGRRMRVVEIIPGVYEEWDGDMIAEFSLKHQGDVSCLSLPYGTCTIKMDNVSRRFEPRSKDGVFQSIEERQGIDVAMAVRLPNGTDEYKRVGMFYQYSGGWKTGDNGITMQWDLVDIVGLLADREFILSDTLPTTLEGWVAALVAQLGINFENRYTVDPNYADTAVSVGAEEDVVGLTCGDILRYVCMATGTWPRADAKTGKLAIEPLWDQGNKLTLDNLVNYPTIKANDDIAAIIFTLNDGNSTKYVVSGNSTASSTTKSINNPFIKTQEQAITAAKQILSAYGGNKLEVVGRGDPSSEIGDVDTIWLNESTATTARRIQQSLSLTDGVLVNVASVLLQADGSFLFENRTIITQNGTWTAPDGVTRLRLILVGKGENGGKGGDGTWEAAGAKGTDGIGGKVWSGTVNINNQQQFSITIDEDTVFGPYSSADGEVYEYGFTDIASGNSYARTGVKAPIPGSGDGGAGGAGGIKGNRHQETITVSDSSRKRSVRAGTGGEGGGVVGPGGGSHTETVTVIDNYPGPGEPGVDGVTGCVVVYWDIPEESA